MICDVSHLSNTRRMTIGCLVCRHGCIKAPAATFEQLFRCYYRDGGRAGWVWRWGGASIIGNGMHVLMVLP